MRAAVLRSRVVSAPLAPYPPLRRLACPSLSPLGLPPRVPPRIPWAQASMRRERAQDLRLLRPTPPSMSACGAQGPAEQHSRKQHRQHAVASVAPPRGQPSPPPPRTLEPRL